MRAAYLLGNASNLKEPFDRALLEPLTEASIEAYARGIRAGVVHPDTSVCGLKLRAYAALSY
jgi:hypothetical protein